MELDSEHKMMTYVRTLKYLVVFPDKKTKIYGVPKNGMILAGFFNANNIANPEDADLILDDIIDSGGTIVNAAKALKEKGAKDVYVFITHAVLSGEAIYKIEKSPIRKLITTDTIDNSKKIGKSKKIEIISLAPMISEAMKRIANSTSVSSLFK